MVSLENKFQYYERIQESPKLEVFHDFLLEKKITQQSDIKLTDADRQFFEIVVSIQIDDKKKFEEIYRKKSKSNPTKDSQLPFVNDDFLIFCLIIGIAKFNLEKEWIKNIISIRNRNSITITLENILNENYFSKSNLPEIVLMFFELTNFSLADSEFLNAAYIGISSNHKLFDNRSDFQILCALSAYDIIIQLKTSPDSGKVYLLNKFNLQFTKRIKILSFIIQFVLFSWIIYLLLKLPEYSPKVVSLVNDFGYFFTLLGALGITFLGNQIDYFKDIFSKLLMRALGYPKKLLKLKSGSSNTGLIK